MSYYFRDKPIRFSDRLRGSGGSNSNPAAAVNNGDDLLESLKRQFEQESKSFFEPTTTAASGGTAGSKHREHPFERHHTGFPRGFPFDDDGFDGGSSSRRAGGNIRSHLDDLAARHPEFADHLLGPPWGDVPFPLGTPTRNRRRGSGLGSSSSYQGHPDEDARSQASGSSAASAASGASGVSSHGEVDTGTGIYQEQQQQQDERERNNENRNSRKGNNPHYQPIPQYGLRNTVDIGQHRHNMENIDNNEKTGRGQRSASAPPENRQTTTSSTQQQQQNFNNEQNQQGTQQPQGSNPNQRFVSRVDITPQQQQQQQQQQSDMAKPPMSTKQQQQHQQQPQSQTSSGHQQQQKSNVRHIPIFVEGRDEPVIPKNVDETTSTPSHQFATHQQQKRPQSPPQFQRPSHFNQHFTGGGGPGNRHQHQQWQQPHHHPQQQFYQQQQPQQQQQPTNQHEQQIPKANHYQQQQQQYRQQQAEKQRAAAQQQQQQQHQQENEQPAAEPPKLKQIQPKEPLERVAIVQKDVDSLMEEVKKYQGDSRQSKEYMYLDEMLTRELIKLDDIETEGKPEVRQARKNAIKSIQDCIAMLESKVPLPGQEVVSESTDSNVVAAETNDQDKSALPMETDADTVKSSSDGNNPNNNAPGAEENVAIPLPPPENSTTQLSSQQGKDQDHRPEERRNVADEPMNEDVAATVALIQTERMDTQHQGDADCSGKTADETIESSEAGGGEQGVVDHQQQQQQQQQQKMDVDAAAAAAAGTKTTTRSPKKTRKAKQPKPVSDVPIPLPPPEVSHT